MEVDLTAHLRAMYLASINTTDPAASNLRVRVLKDVPNGCPATTASIYDVAIASDCSKRRASLIFPIPASLFNCSYATPSDFAVSFYVQVSADLAFDACSQANGTFFAGSRRNALSPGCTYLTIRAACTPATCVVPVSAAGPTGEQQKRNMLAVIVGVAVGTSALLLGILAGILYLRKCERAALRQPHSKCSDGSDGGEDLLSSSDEEYELDFSGRHAGTGTGGVAAVASSWLETMLPPGGGARGSVLCPGRTPMLFSRTPHSMAAKQASVTGTVVEPTMGSCATVTGAWLHSPGEELRQQGMPRFSDKYLDRPPGAPPGSHPGAVSTPLLAAAAPVPLRSPVSSTPDFSARPPPPAPLSSSVAYGNPAYGTPPSFSVPFSGSSVATVGGGVQAGTDEPYHLRRMSTKAMPLSPTRTKPPSSPTLKIVSGTPSTASRPVPVVPLTPTRGRRSSALLLAELGYGAPSPRARRVANPADLSDPELVPEDTCSFINPLAVMCGPDGSGAGAGGAATHSGGSLRGRISASPPRAVFASALASPMREAGGGSVCASQLPGGAWAAVRQSMSSNLSRLPNTGRQVLLRGPLTGHEGVRGSEGSGDEEELVTSTRRRREATASEERQQRVSMATEPSFKLPQVAAAVGATSPDSQAGGAAAGGSRPNSADGMMLHGDPVFGIVLAPAEE